MDAVHIVIEVVAEQFAAIVLEFARVRLCVQACLLTECSDGAGIVIGDGRPAFSVHPGPVQPIVEGQFTQLGDQQGIDVGAVGAGRPDIRFPGDALGRVVRMEAGIACVGYAGIVGIQGDPFFAGDLSPELERVAGEARHGIAQLTGEGSPSRVSLAVHLEEVRTQFAADLPDLLFFQGFAYAAVSAALRGGVEIEVQAEIPAGRVADVFVLGRLSAGCKEQEGDEESDGFHYLVFCFSDLRRECRKAYTKYR